MDDAQLRTVWQQRQFKDSAAPLGQSLAFLMKHILEKRVRQLGRLAEIWDECMPQAIRDHTALESFRDGTLTVMVDSAAHRFQLQTLLEGGLLKELRSRCPQAINKVRLVPGQFYSTDLETGERRYGWN